MVKPQLVLVALAILLTLFVIPSASADHGDVSSTCGSNGHTHNGITYDCWATAYNSATLFWGNGYTQASESLDEIGLSTWGVESCLGSSIAYHWHTGYIEEEDEDFISGGGDGTLEDTCLPEAWAASHAVHNWSGTHDHRSNHTMHHPYAITEDD